MVLLSLLPGELYTRRASSAIRYGGIEKGSFSTLSSPRLELYRVTVRALGHDTYHVRLVVHNTGRLSSYVTKKALEKKLGRGVICAIELPEGASLETGEPRVDAGQLEGRAYKPPAAVGFDDSDPSEDRAKVEWVVHAPQGGACV